MEHWMTLGWESFSIFLNVSTSSERIQEFNSRVQEDIHTPYVIKQLQCLAYNDN